MRHCGGVSVHCASRVEEPALDNAALEAAASDKSAAFLISWRKTVREIQSAVERRAGTCWPQIFSSPDCDAGCRVLAGSALISGITVHYVRGVTPARERRTGAVRWWCAAGKSFGRQRAGLFRRRHDGRFDRESGENPLARVISRSTAMAYKGTHKPLADCDGVECGCGGRRNRDARGNRVRITRSCAGLTDQHLWADTYESPIGDVLALQNRVSSRSWIRSGLISPKRQRAFGAEAVGEPGLTRII